MKDLLSRSLAEHSLALKNKEYSSEELTKAIFERISKIDQEINAYISLNTQQALDQARLSDQRRAKGETLSALDGIPYAAKDNISTRNLKTTCASRMLENYIPPYNAHVIDKLEKSGAVLLGKTNLDEFAMGISTERSHFGATLNPIDTKRVAGGSSGGSAAAVCANEAIFALGSDTGGSVRQPAAFCGLVGMRPTYGAVSRYGLISFAPSLDQIGPITKNVYDNALVMNFISSFDQRDGTSLKHPSSDFTAEIGKDIKGMSIALLDINGHAISEQTEKALDAYAKALETLGAKVTRINLKHAQNAYASYYVLACAEASSNLARFDSVRYGYRGNRYSSLDDIYERSRSEGLGNEVKRRILFGTMSLCSEYCTDFYNSANNMRSLVSRELMEALESYDTIMLPTAPSEAYPLKEALKIGFEACIDDIFCTLAALSGAPALSVPYCENGKMPVGIQFIGKHLSEPALYRLASALETELSGG